MSRSIGQRSSPTRRRDEIAENFVEVLHLMRDAHEANLVHARAQLRRFGAITALITGADALFREERSPEFDAQDEARRESREASRGERIRAL